MRLHFNFRNKKRSSRFFVYFVASLFIVSCSEFDEIYQDLRFPDAGIILDKSKSDTAFLNFFVLSDWGYCGSEEQKDVANEMGRIADLMNPEFVLTCGDNFQTTVANSPEDILWQTNFENVYYTNSLKVPWYPAFGNHDYGGSLIAQIQYSAKSKRWNMPSHYFTFVKPVDSLTSARFIVLDTPGLINAYQNLTDKSKFDTIAQYRWLKTVLDEHTEEWVIVTGHHPMFSASAIHGDTEELKKVVKPLFDEYTVDFYICGHDHHFEHVRENNTDYFVTGTGGNLRMAGRNSRTIYSMSRLGFTYISLSQNLAKLYFITNEGKIGYDFEKEK